MISSLLLAFPYFGINKFSVKDKLDNTHYKMFDMYQSYDEYINKSELMKRVTLSTK